MGRAIYDGVINQSHKTEKNAQSFTALLTHFVGQVGTRGIGTNCIVGIEGLQRGYMTCPMGQGEVSFDLS